MTVVAIDFGTSNTAIAILTTDCDRNIAIPKTLHFDQIAHGFETDQGTAWLVPSLVHVLGSETGDDEFLFGEQARSQYLLENQPKRLFQGFKRDIVANFRSPAREIDGKLFGFDQYVFTHTNFAKIVQQCSVFNLGQIVTRK